MQMTKATIGPKGWCILGCDRKFAIVSDNGVDITWQSKSVGYKFAY